jgi:hypothetical protein
MADKPKNGTENFPIPEKAKRIIEAFLDSECEVTIDQGPSRAARLRAIIVKNVGMAISIAQVNEDEDRGESADTKQVQVSALVKELRVIARAYQKEKRYKIATRLGMLAGMLESISE